MPPSQLFAESIDTELTSDGSPIDFVRDIGTGSNLFLTVTISWGENNVHTIEGVTWDGVALTAFGAQTTQNNNRRHSFYLVAPATGSRTLSVNPSTGGAASDAIVELRVHQDVDQDTPFDGYATNVGTDGSAPFDSTLTIVSEAGDLVCVSHAVVASGGNPTGAAATNYTEKLDNALNTLGVQSGDADGAASVATTATWSIGAGFSIAFNVHGWNLNAAAGGGGDPDTGTSACRRIAVEPVTVQ